MQVESKNKPLAKIKAECEFEFIPKEHWYVVVPFGVIAIGVAYCVLRKFKSKGNN